MSSKLGNAKVNSAPILRINSCLRSALSLFQADLEAINGQRWPCIKWQIDPVGFVREVLKEEPLPHQIEILEAIRDNVKVAVRSGQKCGKTKLLTWAAIWFYCSFPEAKVIMTAAVKDQVDKVMWSELSRTIYKARAKGLSIEAPGATASSGLRAPDQRMIYGFTARDIEAVGGISSPNMLFLVDEASKLPQPFAEAIEGNMAGGGCHLLYISNPTRTEGPFYDAFHSKSDQWATFHLSSEKVAQYLAANSLSLPGVASLNTIERWEIEYKRDSVFFRMRVSGEFILTDAGKIMTVQSIIDAQQRWGEVSEDGLLSIGVDPAGHAVGGDEYAFSIVRGAKLIAIHTFRGLTEDAAVTHIRAFLTTYRRGDEIPQVVVDSEGPIGGSLFGHLHGISEALRVNRVAESFDVFGVKASNPARRAPHLYDKVREELWANLAEWVQTGGIIPDTKLEAELNFPSWIPVDRGKAKVTPKDDIRKVLGRSPDRADSLALAVWQPRAWLVGKPQQENTVVEQTLPDRESAGIDPYADKNSGFDPYKS